LRKANNGEVFNNDFCHGHSESSTCGNYTTITATSNACPACNGSGLQTRNDGIKIICPVCAGCGYWNKPYVPSYPVYPFYPDPYPNPYPVWVDNTSSISKSSEDTPITPYHIQ